MYLKSLEIQGFKSFPDKTVLNFEEDITAIVGPNGSGKSNVSDAIRWVMGEQSSKSLRGNKMEDVIFGGTEKRNQMGYAQVTLVINNTEHIFPSLEETEVAVTRRYYRSGESEYYINRQGVRLRDINELFMDTGMGREGYSIIGQGRIDEILSQKSQERREIFEEAAGISKFRHRKDEAERKLEHTEENLLRINDKISELEMQVEPLRNQAEKAKKYLVLRDELRVLEISVWLETLETLKTNAIKIETDYALAQQELQAANDALAELYTANEAFDEKAHENDMAQEAMRAEIAVTEGKIREQESAIAVSRTEIAHNNESMARIEQERQNRSERAKDMLDRIEEKKQAIASLQKNAENLEAEIQKLVMQAEQLASGVGEAGGEVESLRANEALCVAAAADIRAEISAFHSGIHEMQQRKVTVVEDIESLNEQLASTKKEASESRKALEQAQEDADAVNNIIRGHSMKMEGRVTHEKELGEKRVALTMELNNLDSRIHMLTEMESDYEGFNKAVKLIMQARDGKALRGIHGPIANLINVEKKYTVAIETALGGGMQEIVVDKEEDGKSAINFLKQRNGGRATFLPLTAVRGEELREKGVMQEFGVIGIASQLVKYDAKYDGIFQSLLGKTLIVEDLDCGIAIARKYQNRFRIVTLDGQVMNRGGSMTGGSVSQHAGILSRANELKEITAKRGKMQEQLDALIREHEEAKRALTKAQYELEVAQSQQRTAEDAVLKLSGEKNHYDILLSAMRDRLDDLDTESEGLDGRIAEAEKAIAEKEKEVAKQEAKAEELRLMAQSKAAGQSELLRSSGELSDQISEKKSALAANMAECEAGTRELETLFTMRSQFQGDEADSELLVTQYRTANEATEAQIAQYEAEIAKLQVELEAKQKELAAKNAEKMELEAERSRTGSRLRELNDNVINMSNAVSKLEQKKATTELEEKQLLDKLWENYELSRSDAQAQRIELESVPKANRRVSELKREINALGTVNVGAIEEFDRVNTRYTYLTGQRDDVQQAKEELEGIIENIISEMATIFREQFALIRESFQETFTELFGGGKATLELEDENDVLNCGIEIKAQPQGKMLKSITLLSGGEKAFVAIALYFAILKVHPTPFCVMDEIEAALDESNVIRVANYMRRITDKTQFIVITHRRGTMEAADVLYGVTMQEHGVSKVLTVNMNDIAKQLKIKE